MRISSLLRALAVLGSLTVSAAAQEADSIKTRLVAELLGVMHAPDQAILAIETNLPAQRAANPRIPAAFWDRFLARARTGRDQFVALLIPIYTKHLEQGDLEALLAFYRSEAGQHFLKSQASIIQESLLAGQQWGRDLGSQIAQELRQEGVVLPE